MKNFILIIVMILITVSMKGGFIEEKVELKTVYCDKTPWVEGC